MPARTREEEETLRSWQANLKSAVNYGPEFEGTAPDPAGPVDITVRTCIDAGYIWQGQDEVAVVEDTQSRRWIIPECWPQDGSDALFSRHDAKPGVQLRLLFEKTERGWRTVVKFLRRDQNPLNAHLYARPIN